MPDKESILKKALSLVLHPKGKCRAEGRMLWDNHHLENSGFDPLSLSEDDQIDFAFSMLQDLGNPDLRLPKVLPLFLSGSEKMRKALLMKMIPYVDNYMGHVTRVIEKMGIDTVETRQLKQYVEGRAVSIRKRRELIELSPMYSQYRYFQEALRVESETMSQRLKKFEENDADLWINKCVKEVLGRGGGWRLENGKTQHLSTIKVSVPSRLMVQSMTPFVRRIWENELMKDVKEGDN